MTTREATVPMAVLERFAARVLERVDVGADDARLVANALVTADARGVHSHGVSRLPVDVKRVRAGGVKPNLSGRVESETAATILLDGEDGIGQVVAARAMREAVRKAGEAGAGVVAVRRSNHFGEGAHYVAVAIEQGMIGLITTNGSPNMPYWGAREPVLGTLPLAVGVPAGEEPPIVLDLAFGTVSKGKVLQAATRGERIPKGWGVDSDGKETDDPNAVLDGGWTLPIGAYKGSGLILIMEILSAVLSGARFATEVGDLYADAGASQGLGHFALAIDVAAFMPLEQFTARVDRLIGILKESEGGDGRVFMPGEREHRLLLARRREGVPLPEATLRKLDELAGQVGLETTEEWRQHLVSH